MSTDHEAVPPVPHTRADRALMGGLWVECGCHPRSAYYGTTVVLQFASMKVRLLGATTAHLLYGLAINKALETRSSNYISFQNEASCRQGGSWSNSHNDALRKQERDHSTRPASWHSVPEDSSCTEIIIQGGAGAGLSPSACGGAGPALC